MALPTVPEIAWLADTMAARMLADAADHPRNAQLEEALRFWLPTDEVSAIELIAIRKAVQRQLQLTAGSITDRLKVRMERGTAKPLPGCEGRI